MTFPDIPDTPEPVRRDRYGRYLVVPPEGGKPRPYTRATTIAKTLDDGGGLINWRSRMVAIGLANRPDLVALASTTDPADRRSLDELCERAAEAGGATARRDLGTAIHTMMERSWTDPNYQAPDPYAADIAAVHAALEAAGLTVVPGLHERIVVNDRHQIAGMFDLITTDGTSNYVTDLKTGSSLLGAMGFAIQLAIYANADALYTQGPSADGTEDLREPMPRLDRERGVIVHVQPGSGHCDLHWIDLTFGAEALEDAMRVRAIRKIKPLTKIEAIKPADLINQHMPGAVDVTEVDDEWRDWIRERIVTIRDAGRIEDVQRNWPNEIPTIKSGQPITTTDATTIEALLSKIEADHAIPFPAPKPQDKPAGPASKRRGVPADKNDEMVNQATIDLLNMEVERLDPDGFEWLKKVMAEASEHNRSLKLQEPHGIPAERRYLAAKATVDVARYADDQLAWAILHQATVGKTANHSLGDAFGSLRKTEARKVSELCQQIDSTQTIPVWDQNGCHLQPAKKADQHDV